MGPLTHCPECRAPAHPGACYAPPELAAILQLAIALGIMSEAQARDVDAFADGITARLLGGEITEQQAHALTAAAALRDGEAVNRARARAQGNRAARRAEAAEQKETAMMDPRDRSRCYHCGASGVPLVEWQPDPPRPDVPGPFPMVCANGCGMPAPRIELEIPGEAAQVAAALAALAALPFDRQLELLARELWARLRTPAEREEMRALLVAMPEADRERNLEAMAKLMMLDEARRRRADERRK